MHNFHTDKHNKNAFEKDFDTSNIEIEEIECIINSDDSIFNGIHTEEYHNHTIVMDKFNNNHNRTRDIPPKHRGLHNRESVKKNLTYLNNISKVSSITISNSITSSKSSSEKKRLMLNNRRFNKRPPYVKRANKSLAHLTSIPYIMSESNLHSREDTEINVVPKGIDKVREELKSHFHNRHMSNPANFSSPLNIDKNIIASKVQASSRLMLNRLDNQSRVRLKSN
jgi:hypothetical protein